MVRFTRILLGSVPVLDQMDLIAQLSSIPEWADINSITCPAGEKPGKGAFLIAADKIGSLTTAGSVNIVWTFGTTGGGASQVITFRNYVITEITEAVAADGSPFIVRVADQRQIYRHSAITKRYNVRYSIGDKFYDETEKQGQAFTWSEVVTDLASQISGVGIAGFALEANPNSTPENLIFAGQSAWAALNEVSGLTNHVAVYDPITGLANGAELNKVQAGLAAQIAALDEKRRSNPTPANFGNAPQNVRVFFNWRPGEGNSWFPKDPFFIDVATNITGASAGFATVWSPVLAETDYTTASAPPINSAVLNQSASEVADAWIDEFTSRGKPRYIRFSGLEPFATGSELQAVRWMAQGAMTSTEIYFWQGDEPELQRYPKHTEPLSNSGYVVKVPDDGIPARVGVVPGSVLCKLFRTNETTNDLEQVVDTLGADVSIPVFNHSDSAIRLPTLFVTATRDWQGQWFVGSAGDSAGTIMRFFTTGKIVDREVEATVDYVTGGVINPITGQAYKAGDTVTVSDPGQQWGEIEKDATGIAYYRKAVDPSSPLSEEERWEIEECSLPINRIMARITTCLKYSDLLIDVVFGSAAEQPLPDWILSSFNNADFPPEAVIDSTESFSIADVRNPFKLDAVKDSFLLITRHTDVDESDPRNLTVPKPKSSTSALWEITQVFEQIARWARFVSGSEGSSFTLSQFWEGADPRLCGDPVVVCAFDCSCLKAGDEVIAFYAPKEDIYIAISSASALLGSGDTENVVTNIGLSGCDILYTDRQVRIFCAEDPQNKLVIFPKADINSFTGAFGSTSQICLEFNTFSVISCENKGADFVCIDICPLLCFCDEIFFSLPDVCTPPPCNCCECLFFVGVLTLTIDRGSDPQSATQILPSSQPCEWLAEFDDQANPGSTIVWTIEYQCDGLWVAGGPWPGTVGNGDIINLVSTDGGCGGSTTLADVSESATGIVTADGSEECQPCDECSTICGDGRLFVTDIAWEQDIDDNYALHPDGPNVRQTAECTWLVDIQWTIDIDPVVTQDDVAEITIDNPGGLIQWNIRPLNPPVNKGPGEWKIQQTTHSICAIDQTCSCGGTPCGPPGPPDSCVEADPSVINFARIDAGFEACGPPGQEALMAATEAVIETTPEAPKLIATAPRGSTMKLGDLFARANPKLFSGCKCKKDIVQVMNRWSIDVEPHRIDTVAHTISAKNHTVSFDHARLILTKFMRAQSDG